MERDPIVLAERALGGHQGAGARLIRMLEEGDEGATEGLRAVLPSAGRAHLLGVTGPPGAGKSTLVDRMAAEYRRRGSRVGIIAVDPSSPFTGGAVLGDRVRMHDHAADPGVFIRSMATRGQLGGLARATFEATTVLDAMGYDVVLIETVGVGQDEVDVADLAHTTVVVSIPGMGDDVQAIKAGILEIADLFVVNKADLPGADRVAKHIGAALHMRAAPIDAWQPPILMTEAERAGGIVDVIDGIDAHRAHLRSSGGLDRKVIRRRERVFHDVLRERAAARALACAPRQGAEILSAMRSGELDPYTAVEALLGVEA